MFYFGVDYYPEHWPEERWSIDARLMAEAGFNVVRLAEFAWSKMEAVEGCFDFDWLDQAISILQRAGIKIVLGTPTASPPAWLMYRHPELFRVREDGQRVTFGNRREYCPNHPLYHDYSQRIVTQMAERYARHPAVIGWQIDNEFGERCYCPICAIKFREWLKRRYLTLEELNQQWGTIFWSHTYHEWAEIPLPLTTGGSPNPGLALDFYRFCSDSYVAFQQVQVDILRRNCPSHFITHNFMGFGFDRLNYFDLAQTLDFVAWDNYPRMQWTMQNGVEHSRYALAHATMRGLKRRNFWIMEHQAGSGGWEMISVAPRPGELRLWAYQAIAHGADGVLFFCWRTARFGTEQYWHGLLDHDGTLGRRYEEAKCMGAEIKKVGDQLTGAEVKAQVAMLLSYEARFAFQIQPNNPYFNYSDHFAQIYRSFYQHSIGVDVVAPNTEFSPYKLVIAPALHLVTESIAENLKCYVQAGGILVVTQRTGVKNEANAIVNQRLPGLLAEICGLEVEEYDSLSSDMSNSLEFIIPELADTQPTVGVLCEILKPTSATVIARYVQDFYTGRPAITLNHFGKGQVIYVGAVGEWQLYEALAGWLLNKINVKPALAVCKGIEVTERWQGTRQLLFILNHNDSEQQVILDKSYINLFDGSTLYGKIQIAARDVLLLTRKQE